MKNKKARLDILEQLENGELSPEDAARLLQEDPQALLEELQSPLEILEALEGGKISTEQAANKLGESNSHRSHQSENFPDMEIVKGKETFIHKTAFNSDLLWTNAIAVGTVMIVLSVWWMASRLEAYVGMDFWFFVAWFPFLIGLFLLVLAWMSKNSPWIRIRIRSKRSGESFRINLGFPLPKRLLLWGIERSKRVALSGVNVMEIESLLNNFGSGNMADPVVIQVDDDDDDVEIIMG